MPHPSKPNKTTNKTHIVSFRLTETQYTKLAHYAATANMRVNSIARKLILSKAQRLTIKTHTTQDPALIQQLHHIGHNLNQMTKAVHLGRIPPQIEGLCQRIENLIDEALNDEGKENDQ